MSGEPRPEGTFPPWLGLEGKQRLMTMRGGRGATRGRARPARRMAVTSAVALGVVLLLLMVTWSADLKTDRDIEIQMHPADSTSAHDTLSTGAPTSPKVSGRCVFCLQN